MVLPVPKTNSTMESDLMLNLTIASLGDLRNRFDSNYTTTGDNQTVSLLKTLTTTQSSTLTSTVKPLEAYNDDGSIIAKITLLLVVTAVVLVASYKFVVRLFLGYTDRKDEVVPDGFSDDDDSAIVKRVMGPSLDIG